jgi:hypothetical protein
MCAKPSCRFCLFFVILSGLLISSPAWAGFGVSPMLICLEAEPGTSAEATINLNSIDASPPNVRIHLIDVKQRGDGQLVPADTNDVGYYTNARSCRSWVSLDTTEDTPIRMPAMGLMPLQLTVKIPAEARGFYSAGVLIHMEPDRSTSGVSLCYDFLVPVFITIPGDTYVPHIQLVRTTLENDCARQWHRDEYARIRLDLENLGLSLKHVTAYAHITTVDSDNASCPVGLFEFEGMTVLPGTQWYLESDYFDKLPPGRYAVRGSFSVTDNTFFEAAVKLPAPKDANTVSVSELNPTNNALVLSNESGLQRSSETFAAIEDNKSVIRVSQNINALNPYQSYRGAILATLSSNFLVTLETTIRASSPAGGQWELTADPSSFNHEMSVELLAQATDVHIEKLIGDAKSHATVAKAVVRIAPSLRSGSNPVLRKW